MKAVVQRVSGAKVLIDGKRFSEIGPGSLVLLGIEHADQYSDIQWLVDKIVKMRIFPDDLKPINASLSQIGGDIMVVSQFTLHASTKKGNRPSFTYAAGPEQARKLYHDFLSYLRNSFDGNVVSGQFGKDMQLHLINDGPVTIIIDSKNRI
ncbi:UNVERIFIED_CONTAM: hypothetical protein GTU68_062996 [Idotea baltica]|nr:hypothetical protein [Idotea baltica]